MNEELDYSKLNGTNCYNAQGEDGKDAFEHVCEQRNKLQNNWNELKKWLATRINTDKDYEQYAHVKEKLQVEDYVIKQVMLYMQELEEGKDD